MFLEIAYFHHKASICSNLTIYISSLCFLYDIFMLVVSKCQNGVSKTYAKSKQMSFGHDLDLAFETRSHFLVLFASRGPGETRPRAWNVWKSLNPSLSLLRWNKLEEETWNSKIDWNNSCENNCHRNMRSQSGHILPVMNSKYMWCIRVTLMAQLCHEKIQACTRGTEMLFCKSGNRKHNIKSLLIKGGLQDFQCENVRRWVHSW